MVGARACLSFLGSTGAAALLAAGLGGAGPDAAQAAVIVKKAGAGSATQLSQAVTQALQEKPVGGPPRVLELSGDAPADSARIARETSGESILFAIGPDATEAAGEARRTAVVSLGVPNPARIRTPGTYVSIYPKLERVFEYVKTQLKAKQVGLVFTPARNREIALAFLKAGESQGVTVVPVSVTSSGDLIRELKQALPKVDVLLLAVDPILFDPPEPRVHRRGGQERPEAHAGLPRGPGPARGHGLPRRTAPGDRGDGGGRGARPRARGKEARRGGRPHRDRVQEGGGVAEAEPGGHRCAADAVSAGASRCWASPGR